MSFWTLLAGNLRYHAGKNLAVMLGAALATAILVGALAVGDSVRESLRELALARLGRVELAVAPPDRFFTADLAAKVQSQTGAPTAAVLSLPGLAASDTARVNRVKVLGVDEAFWKLGGEDAGKMPAGLMGETPMPRETGGQTPIVLNAKLAAALNVKPGDQVLLRISPASANPGDQFISGPEKTSLGLRGVVAGVADDGHLGRFDLRANQLSPYNAFVPLEALQALTKQDWRANMLLVGGTGVSPLSPERLQRAIHQVWTFADAGLQCPGLGERLGRIGATGQLQLISDRVFLDAPVGAAAAKIPGAVGVLTYLVNEIRSDKGSTPYSMVTAWGPLREAGGVTEDVGEMPATGEPPQPGRSYPITINQWLADDLQVRPGEPLTLSYFVLGPGRQLVTRETSFTVGQVVPLAGEYADRQLMPDFPGLAEADRASDWKPGFDIDFYKIRPKDDQYWHDHRGTPKAFVSLPAGQAMWANRFGNLTAVRFPPGTDAAAVEKKLLAEIDPAALGLAVMPVRAQALAAAQNSQDFGQLFLGFSMFLIVSALLLTGLLFGLALEQRSSEVGTLLAVGFTPGKVRRLLLAEGLMLALGGAALGAAGGLLYAKAALAGLSSIWSGAVMGSAVELAVRPATVAIGSAAGALVAILVIVLGLRRQARAPITQLLAGGADRGLKSASRRGVLISFITAGILALAAGGMLAGAFAAARPSAEMFFGAGSCILLAAMAGCLGLLQLLSRRATAGTLLASKQCHPGAQLTLGGLALRNLARRRGRSLAVAALLACGSFVVIAVGANRLSAPPPEQRDSGTGGFAFYGQSSLPITIDLNTDKGRRAAGLGESAGEFSVVPLRVQEGDDASCLNLNRAGRPVLLGVDPAALKQRHAFAFSKSLRGPANATAWSLLDEKTDDDAVPAIGDASTVEWGLGSKLGGTLVYTDEAGRPLRLRIVAVLENSIFQGSLLVSETNFVKKFPSTAGYRAMLVDSPPQNAPATAAALSRALQDRGLDLQPAGQRLAEFQAVENTYLAIFQALGGLGLVLGSLALGLIILRNVMQRRGELALLRAVGFANRRIGWLVLSEHWVLLGLGLLSGVAAGLLAAWPAAQARSLPAWSLGLTVLAVTFSGALWTLLATMVSLRGSLLSGLRSE